MEPIVTGVIVWLPRLVIRDSGLTSSKSGLEIAAWLPGLVTVDNGMVSWAGGCGLWVRILLLCVVRPLSSCVFRLSRCSNEHTRYSPGPHGACIQGGKTGTKQANKCIIKTLPSRSQSFLVLSTSSCFSKRLSTV